MAIVNCPECGKKISNLAEHCPSCGIAIAELRIEPDNESTQHIEENKKIINKKKLAVIFSICIVILVLGALMFVFFNLNSQEQAEVDTLISEINELPDNIKISDESRIERCHTSYENLKFNQKIRINNKSVLKDAVKTLSELKVQNVIDSINEIGEVSISNKVKIDVAQKAYDSLSDAEKSKVHNYLVLENAIKKCDQLLIETTVGLINDIGIVSIESVESIEKAEVAYNNLDSELKSKVDNKNTLIQARNDLDDLLIQKTIEQIDSIGTVSIESEQLLNEIKECYKKISKEKQSKVTNYGVLTSAENTLLDLIKAKEEEEKILTPGDVISSNKWQITYKKTNLSAKIYPDNTSGYYMYYYCDDDQVFVDIVTRVKNIDTDVLKIDGVVDNVEVNYDGIYKYDSYKLYMSEGDDIDPVYNWDALEALDSITLHIVVAIPREAQSNEKSIHVSLQIAGQEKTITVRE